MNKIMRAVGAAQRAQHDDTGKFGVTLSGFPGYGA
jgi:hypothetical protein